MNIGLNGSALMAPLTGVGQYVHHLASGLVIAPQLSASLFTGREWVSQLPDVKAGHGTSVSMANGASSSRSTNLVKSVTRWIPESVQLPLRRHILQRRFSQGARRLKLELYHEPNFLAYDFDGKVVLTVHDLSWIRFESTHPIERVRDMNRWFPGSLTKADRIIVASQFVKQELQTVFDIPAHRIAVVPNGVEAIFSPKSASDIQGHLTNLDLNVGQYWLSVGTIEPRKNLETVFDAFSSLPPVMRKARPMVLVGPRGWGANALHTRIEALEAKGEVRWLGFLTRETLAAITAGATALIYPSLYEGFGLPPLEAMACGVPVIVSASSSLPELVGSAGLLTEAKDAAQIAAYMHRLVQDPAYHQQYAQASLEQSRQFSWARCVQETMTVYAQVMECASVT